MTREEAITFARMSANEGLYYASNCGEYATAMVLLYELLEDVRPDLVSCACKPENSPSVERTTDKGMFIPSAPNDAETGDFSAKEALAEIGKAFVKFGEAIDKAVK